MSTAKYSGIAVAAANRAALARQEAEAERASSVRHVDAKEMALLQHLRKTMTAESILGAGGTAMKKGDEERWTREASASGRTETDATRSPRVEPSGDGFDDRDEGEARAPSREKRHMSKAERKRLKRDRSRVVEEAPSAKKKRPPTDVDGTETEKNEERRVKKGKKAKKDKKKSSTLGPVARPRP